MKHSAVVYDNFAKAVLKLPESMQGQAYAAYMKYATTGEDYEGDNFTIAALLEAFKEQIDEDRSKYKAKAERTEKLNRDRSAKSRNDNETKSERNRDDIVAKSSRERSKVGGDNVIVNVNDIKKEKEKEKEKKPHGAFGRVLLTEDEYQRLNRDYGLEKAKRLIDFLDAWIQEDPKRQRDYSKKDHNLAIRRWVVSAVDEQESRARYKPTQQRAPDRNGMTRDDDLDSILLGQIINNHG